MNHAVRSFTFALGLVAGLAACDQVETPLPEGETLDFRSADYRANSATFDAQRALGDIEAPPERLSDEQELVIERIAGQPEGFLRERPPTAVLNEAELVFFAAGRLFELAGWYADAVERGVVELRPRVAWAYERTGLHTEALGQARLAVEERPDAAEGWFVLGYVLGQSDQADDDLLREIREAFAKAVELDPALVGPSDVTAAELQRQVRDIDARLMMGGAPRGTLPRGAVPRGAVPGQASPHGESPHGMGNPIPR